MSGKPSRPQRSEFKKRLHDTRAQLESFFYLLADDKEQPVLGLETSSLQLLNEVSRLVQFQISAKQVPALAASCMTFAQEAGGATVLSCSQFLSLLRKWYRANGVPLASLDTQVSDLLRTQLKKTIIQYKLQLGRVSDPDERSNYKQLIDTLKQQQTELRYGHQISFSADLNRAPSPEEEKGLKDIFKFYAAQHSNTGRTPTFEAITESAEKVDLGSFLHFCKDFGLYRPGDASRQLRSLQKDELTTVYKKLTPVARKMAYEGFLAALDVLADDFFNGDYNSLHPGPCDCTLMPLWQKRILLYEMMGSGDPKHYFKTCKPFQRAFASTIEPGARIFEDDLSFKYKARTSTRVRERIHRYKEAKVKEKEDKETLERTKNEQQAKEAITRIREKMEVEEGRRNRNLLRFEELPAMTSKDLLGDERHVLEDLVSDS